jgi:hypothetical protein
MIFELHYIVYHFYFPEAFLQVKKLIEKTYSETEQNMSEKQGKGLIMLHLPSLHIMANLHVHSSVHFFHNIFNIGIIIIGF